MVAAPLPASRPTRRPVKGVLGGLPPSRSPTSRETRCSAYASRRLASHVTPSESSAAVALWEEAATRASSSRSRSSSSLMPSADRILTPLSGCGLWLAEITTPASAATWRTSQATPGVGITPAQRSVPPAPRTPEATQRAISSVLSRVSPPATTTGLSGPFSAIPRTSSYATCSTTRRSSGGRPNAPRIPSVPKRREDPGTQRPPDCCFGEGAIMSIRTVTKVGWSTRTEGSSERTSTCSSKVRACVSSRIGSV